MLTELAEDLRPWNSLAFTTKIKRNPCQETPYTESIFLELNILQI